MIEQGYYAYYTYYPLVTPIYIPRGRPSSLSIVENGVTEPSYYGYNVSGSRSDESYFLSLGFKLTEASSLYATYDRATAILGTSNFGGLDVNAVNGDTSSQQLPSNRCPRSAPSTRSGTSRASSTTPCILARMSSSRRSSEPRSAGRSTR